MYTLRYLPCLDLRLIMETPERQAKISMIVANSPSINYMIARCAGKSAPIRIAK